MQNNIKTFSDFGFSRDILRALDEINYKSPTPIQKESIPLLLESHDLLGCAETGTGKTAAFSLPILEQLFQKKKGNSSKFPKCLVLAPTRELAAQIGENVVSFAKYLGLSSTVIFGGVGQRPQEMTLKKGVDVLIATPGRLVDLMNQKLVQLNEIEFLVLDEADRMLDMGFLPAVRKIISHLPKKRQNIFFSATMTQEMESFVSTILVNPKRVQVTPIESKKNSIVQTFYLVEKANKKSLLLYLFQKNQLTKTILFSKTKHGANKITEFLNKNNIPSAVIHGNKSQSAREKALEGFKKGTFPVLVATDIAARGIDIDDISHVINFDLPNVPETYVHRIGRTARAGKTGHSYSLCDSEERAYLKDIARVTQKELQFVKDHPFHSETFSPPPSPKKPQNRPSNSTGNRWGRKKFDKS